MLKCFHARLMSGDQSSAFFIIRFCTLLPHRIFLRSNLSTAESAVRQFIVERWVERNSKQRFPGRCIAKAKRIDTELTQ